MTDAGTSGGEDASALDGGDTTGAPGDIGDGPGDTANGSGDTASDAGDADTGAPPLCESGIDTDGDGVCDRLRADWSRTASLPEGGDRRDIFGLGDQLGAVASRGVRHAHRWPVTVSGVLLPWGPIFGVFDPNTSDPDVLGLQGIARSSLGFGTIDEMYDWLGLARWDGQPLGKGPLVWPEELQPGEALGAARIAGPAGDSLTFSCATCHTASLFGHTVYGLSNRYSRANSFFHLAKQFFPLLSRELLSDVTNATEAELDAFDRTQEHLRAVGTKLPEVRGLDTSLAQVSASLARRREDADATRDPVFEETPRVTSLDTEVADSKPAVWWTLKYKTRWLADGSIVSGNPIFTNFLWNELGRGTDLPELRAWLDTNLDVVDELTAAVFATEAPRITEIIPTIEIDEDAARRGQGHYEMLCASCHGGVTKGWDEQPLPAERDDRLATRRIDYPRVTAVVDVGTDLGRANGMAAFADRLNALAISQWMGTVVEVQSGYVPPPLEGIWARYPYLHNGSVPNLCALLTPAAERPAVFWLGPDLDPATDYDAECVGLPADATPAAWKLVEGAEVDTQRPGLSNAGHESMFVDAQGQPLLTPAERRDLIEFLKVL